MMYGLTYLKNKLAVKRIRGLERYGYYEMKNRVRDLKISTPPGLEAFSTSFGWCAKAVDSLADRLTWRKFKADNFGLNEIFQLNNPDVLFQSAIKGALIVSCSFIYISPDADGYPRLQVVDGTNATGVIDPITNLLSEGYAVLERDELDRPTLEAYFEPFRTTYFRSGQDPEIRAHTVPYPLLVPIIFQPDARRPFGHSRISRAAIGYQDAAMRTAKRSEVSAEFYSFPQKYVVGLSDEAPDIDKWAAAMSAMMRFDKDADGDHPILGQFQMASQTPHLEQLRMCASLFAGETGLTMDDLGFATGNPASAEAIKSAHESIARTADSAKRAFGTGFLNAGMLAACLRDNLPYQRDAFYETEPSWYPTFGTDAQMLSVLGDSFIKLAQAIPGIVDAELLTELSGIEVD